MAAVYIAGIKKLLSPALYPFWTEFVTEHLRFSLFAPCVVLLVRISHLSLDAVLFALYLAGIWGMLFAGWLLASRVTQDFAGRLGGVVLLACWLTLPIAGTSLMLMDPYVTARTLSTPLVLAALAWALDRRRACRRWARCVASLLLAALMHPLMAGYGVAAILAIVCVRHGRRACLCFVLAAAGAAGALNWFARPESAAYVRVAITRYYWFLSQWQWYEWLGWMAPPLLLWWLVRQPQGSKPDTALRTVGYAAILLALTSVSIALLFCRQAMPAHLVARMQPLRSLQIVYEVMIVLLGSWLGRTMLRERPWRWALVLLLLGMTMRAVQRSIYPNSAHIEYPGAAPANAWERAFLWVRTNTPQDALFALDARYITRGHGEDAQCFRAIAERSALPDYSKDGGEASITPELTGAWMQGQTAQTNLEAESDADRLAALHPLDVTWIVLERSSPTAFACPYRNERVKVCRLAP